MWTIPTLDVSTLRFGEPAYLWLLGLSAALLAVWVWRVARRRRDVRRMRQGRVLPLRERFSLFGDLAFWLCALVAASLVIVALARPQALTSRVQAGERRHRHPAGCLGVDVRQRRSARPVAALGPVPADVRRVVELAGRSRRAGAVRAARGAAGAAHQGSQLALLLHRSSRRALAVSARERADLGHEHRGGAALGAAAGREGRGAVRQERQPESVPGDLGRPGVDRQGGRVAAGRAAAEDSRCTSSASAPASAA